VREWSAFGCPQQEENRTKTVAGRTTNCARSAGGRGWHRHCIWEVISGQIVPYFSGNTWCRCFGLKRLKQLESGASVKLCACWVDIPIARATRVLVAFVVWDVAQVRSDPSASQSTWKCLKSISAQMCAAGSGRTYSLHSEGSTRQGRSRAPGPPPAPRSRVRKSGLRPGRSGRRGTRERAFRDQQLFGRPRELAP
jgi:hypothetical protein